MNFKIKYFLATTLFVVSLCLNLEVSKAQIFDSGFVYIAPTPQLTAYPPLNTGMPFDVLIGYIYLDSMRRNWPPPRQADSIMTHMPYSQIKYALKYLYETNDFNPLLFEQYSRTIPSIHYYRQSGGYIKAKLTDRARSFSDTQRTEMICYADIIAQVHVNNVDTLYNNWTHSHYPNQRVISCEVIDSIKGFNLPACWDIYSNSTHPTPLSVPRCLQFCYSPQEPLQGTKGDVSFGGSTMTDTLGNDWVKNGQDYVAFLLIEGVGNDSNNYYYTICPSKILTTQGSLYRIEAGHVLDPNNDLGFGTTPTTADFVAGLRNKIYSIKHP